MTSERYGRCMKRGRRDVVRAFLDELGAVPFTEDARLYRIGRRLLLAELVLAEIRDDDLERMAIRSLAEVAREQCLSPIDREPLAAVRRPDGSVWDDCAPAESVGRYPLGTSQVASTSVSVSLDGESLAGSGGGAGCSQIRCATAVFAISR